MTLRPALLAALLMTLTSVKAQPDPDSLRLLFRHSESDEQKASTLISLSKTYLVTNLDTAFFYAKKAQHYTSSSPSLRIEVHDQMAKCYFFQSQLDSALYHFSSATELAREIDEPALEANLGNSIGAVLLRQARFEEAIQRLVKSATYFESVGDPISAAKSYNNIASAHAELKDYEEAIHWSKEALETFQTHQMTDLALITLPNLATQYVKVGDTTNAIKYFQQATELGYAQNNKRSLAITHNNLGDLFMSRREWQTAQSHIEKSIELKRELNIQKGLGNAYHNLGYIYWMTGSHGNAISLFEKALNNSDPTSAVVIYDRLKDCHKAIGEIDRALYYAEISQALRDSISTFTNTKNFAEISEKYQSAKQENEILRLTTENQKLVITRNRNLSLFIGTLGLILTLSLLGFLYYKNAKKKQIIAKTEADLERQKMLEKLKDHELDTVDLIIQGQDEERARIASDLHDSLGSKMATLLLYLNELNEDKGQSSPSHVNMATDLANASYQEIRDLSHNLSLGVSIEDGLVTALQEMARYINLAKDLTVEVFESEIQLRLGNRIELQLFRVIQELVTNTIKHARANRVLIQLTQHEDDLNIIVEDDGVGFDINNTELGMGLINVENRLERIGAQYQFDSSPKHGTTVIINVPI